MEFHCINYHVKRFVNMAEVAEGGSASSENEVKKMSISSFLNRYCYRFRLIAWLTVKCARVWCLGSGHLFIARNHMKNSSRRNSRTPLLICVRHELSASCGKNLMFGRLL